MKILSITILHATPAESSKILASASDLSSFSFFQRGSIQEFLAFFSVTVADRTLQGQRQCIKEKDYIAHVYHREDLVGSSVFQFAVLCLAHEEG